MCKVKQDKELCIGCGACVALCPKNWEMDGMKAKPKSDKCEKDDCNMEAAEACPAQCIHIYDKEGKKLI